MTVSLGVTNHPAPWDMTALDAFEEATGRKVAILSYFVGYAPNNPPELDRLQAIAARGAVPMITWEWHQLAGWRPLIAIAKGQYDADLKLWAGVFKTSGGPVLLRWGHEMNGTWFPWSVGANGTTKADYVAAFQRIVKVIRSVAPNVQFVWSPNVLHGAAPFAGMYPGGAYVDWLALDGYNWAGLNGTPAWSSFSEVFTDSYKALLALSAVKPVMLAEWGCHESANGSKALWLMQALAVDIPDMARIAAVVYFNDAADGAEWPLASSSEALAAYRAGIAYARPVYGETLA